MIAHHFLVYDFGMHFSNTWVGIGNCLKICVGIYAVLSGYGYFFSKEKTVNHGIKKIWSLLQIYWLSLFTLFIPAALLGGWEISIKSAVINLFALGPNLNWNAWYVYFFIFCMLIMPLIYKVFKFKPAINVLIAVVIPYLIEAAIYVLIPNYQSFTILQVIFNCMSYWGIFLIGYLMAQYDILNKLKLNWLMGIALMLIAFLLRIALRHINTFGFNIDTIYAPIFVIGGAKFFGGLRAKWLAVFSILGKYSTGMWFFHAVFFSTYVCDWFQPLMKLVSWAPLMYIWLVILSLLGAFIYQKILDSVHYIPQLVKRGS